MRKKLMPKGEDVPTSDVATVVGEVEVAGLEVMGVERRRFDLPGL